MEPVQRTVPAFLATLLRKAPLSDEKVAFAWRSSVGPAISRVTSVRLSNKGVVEVHCADDHWRREVRRSAPVIKQRMAALLGDEVVRELKVPAGSRKRHLLKP